MRPKYPSSFMPPDKNKADEIKAPESRFVDEKPADAVQALPEKTFAPAGLNNPFWN